jgi:hypothetical protein
MVGRQQAEGGRTTTAESGVRWVQSRGGKRFPRAEVRYPRRPAVREGGPSKPMRATKPKLPLGRGGKDARTAGKLEPSQKTSRVQAPAPIVAPPFRRGVNRRGRKGAPIRSEF